MTDEYYVEITRHASEQLHEIVHYISHELGLPDTARKMISLLESKIFSLDTLPYRIKLTDEEPWHSKEVRKMTVKQYFVYFWIDEEEKKVFVFSVIYAHRDQVRQLSKLKLK